MLSKNTMTVFSVKQGMLSNRLNGGFRSIIANRCIPQYNLNIIDCLLPIKISDLKMVFTLGG